MIQKSDRLIITFSTLLFFFFAYKFFTFNPSLIDQTNKSLIATVTDIESSVKRKIEGTILWSGLSDNANIYNGDQVFTDKNSSVELKFKDNSVLTVPENSLVKIEERENDIELDLKKGLVNIDFSKFKNKKVRLKLGDKKVELSSKNKGLVKVSNINNRVEFTSNNSEIIASEVTETGVVKSEKLIIKKGQKVIIPSKKGNWENELSSVGRRVDKRLTSSQAEKIKRIVKEELKSSSSVQSNYRRQLPTLKSRADQIEISPKELAIDELKLISTKLPKKQRVPFEKAIRRIRTVRELKPLKSSVENYVDNKFPQSPVLQKLAREEVLRASRKKAYRNNTELLSSIGKSFDKLGVKRVTRKPRMLDSNQIAKFIGQEVHKEVSYDQIVQVKKKSKSPKIIKEANDSFVKVYKNERRLSPLATVAPKNATLKKSLNQYEASSKINKIVLKKLDPILSSKLNKLEKRAVENSIKTHKFSATNLSVDRDLQIILRPYNSKLSSRNSKWSTSLRKVSKDLEKENKTISSAISKDQVNEGVLKKITTELMVSETEPVYKDLKKEVLSINTSQFLKRPSRSIKNVSKNLESKNIKAPVLVDNSSWTMKLSKIGKQVEQRLVDDQVSELTYYSPELKDKIITDSQLLTKSPKLEVKKLLISKKSKVTFKDRAQVEKALVKTKDLQVQKQELYEEITNELKNIDSPEAKEIIKTELQKVEFTPGSLNVQQKLISIGKMIDAKGIAPLPIASSSEVTSKSFLGKLVKEEKKVIVKPLPQTVEAGTDTRMLIGKVKGEKSDYKVEFSKTKDFNKISYSKKIKSNVAKLNFSKTGEYFYRVSKTVDIDEAKSFDIKHTDVPKKYSPVQKISIAPPSAPVVEKIESKVVAPKEFTSLPFKWSGPSNETYELELEQKAISKTQKPIKKIIRVKGTRTNLNLGDFNVEVDDKTKTLNAKDISYRVRKVGRVESKWSDKKVASVGVKSFVSPVKEQENKVYVKRRFKKKATLPFEWKSGLPNEEHVLTVAKDKDFKKVIVKKVVKGNKAKVTTTHEGPIFWKVAPKVFPKNAKLPVSKKTVLSSTIRIDKKIVKKNIPVSTNTPTTKVNLGWRYTRPTLTKTKQIEVSKDPEFKEIVATKKVPTETKKAKFDLKGKGQYYWRVKDVGAKASNISGVNSFNIVENVNIPIPSIKAKQIIEYKIVNDLPAYEIELPSVKNASYIELEIYSDESLTKLVLKKKFKRKRALWVTNRSGKFFYRVRSVSKTGKKSKFTVPGKLIFPISPLIRSDLE